MKQVSRSLTWSFVHFDPHYQTIEYARKIKYVPIHRKHLDVLLHQVALCTMSQLYAYGM